MTGRRKTRNKESAEKRIAAFHIAAFFHIVALEHILKQYFTNAQGGLYVSRLIFLIIFSDNNKNLKIPLDITVEYVYNVH